MKVLVLGGYGVFGSRLCRLIIADGHQVLVAGRSFERATSFCSEHGGKPLQLDARDTPALATALGQERPDVLVDAAGPFQNREAEGYPVARAALAAGAHYMDLSDDAAFSTGIVELDQRARDAGRLVLSGVSSVPALSAAAANALVAGLSEVTLISAAILPGNKAPRGRSVMSAILSQVGEPVTVWRGGVWRTVTGWSGRVRVSLAGGMRRSASYIGAPDLRLFPAAFQARSVLFRAGLELHLFHRSLSILSALRRRRLIPCLARFVGPFHWAASRFERFGTDTGGMHVMVCGRTADGRGTRRSWIVVARSGDGPSIPAVPAATLLAKLDDLPVGARAALHEWTLDEAETALSRLNTETRRDISHDATLFERALGPAWHDLPGPVRRMHDVWDLETHSGRAEVTRGTHPLARLIAALFRFPVAARDVPITVRMERCGAREVWTRDFEGRRFTSHLSQRGPGRLMERFGPLRFELDTPANASGLSLPVRRGWFLFLPLPRFMLPTSQAREFVTDGVFRFDVRLSVSIAGLLVHYQGWLEPDAAISPNAVQARHVRTSETDQPPEPNRS